MPLLFAVVMLESFGIPLPGETALIAFGVLASQGHYSIVEVIAVAAAGAIIGDNLGYWLIGRLGGRRLFERTRYGRRYADRFLPEAERLMAKHGGKVVFFGRFISILRFTAAWAAGIARMPWWRFLFWNAAGGICLGDGGRARRLLRRRRRGRRDPALRDLRRRRDRDRRPDRLLLHPLRQEVAGKAALARRLALALALAGGLVAAGCGGGSVGATVPKVAPPSVRVPALHARRGRRVREPRGDARSPATPTRRPSTRSRAATRP